MASKHHNRVERMEIGDQTSELEQDLSHGLCNGIRLCLVNMTNGVLNVRIISGPFAGETALIPWMTMSITPEQLLFELHWQQFPMRPAFAMTINKSQGQSFGTVGIDLCYIFS